MNIVYPLDWSNVFEIIANSGTTLLAAFFGAWFAFRLHSKGEVAKERVSHIQNANLNLSLLADQARQVSTILEHLVPEGVEEDMRHYVIKPIVPDNNIQFLSLDLESLGFAIKSEPTLVSDLSSIQRDINTALGLVKVRSQLHINFLQPAVEAIHAQHGGDRVPANFAELLRAQLGFRRDFELQDATNRMIAALNLAQEFAERGFALLSKATICVYPDAKLVPKPVI